ncbi:FAD-dependent oxidoreductase [Ruegeria pomeroyi]|uniref:NAD(P)/FAD-dependent oxidoreductase n=1 Tax=Ruegeria pomeroyi TaxID=89184 RepID=UPI001F905628|nr:FAD-dependent oxidoreductase [Ruegeria pomeroyi]
MTNLIDALHECDPKALILASAQQVLLDGIKDDQLPDITVIVEKPQAPVAARNAKRPGVTVLHVSDDGDAMLLLATALERLLRPRPRAIVMPRAPQGETLLVGSGIVNLVTALDLVKAGHEVTVVDRMPNPLEIDSFDRLQTGATFGGMDARIFSLNESRHHLFRGHASNVAAHQPFRKRVSDAGWLSRDHAEMSAEEQRWIDRLEGLPGWLSGVYNTDIVSQNQASAGMWDALFAQHPQLLRGVNYNPTLLRIYQSEASFDAAQRLERHLGAFRRVIANHELAQLQPCFAEAIAAGAIAGALEVEGFSLNIKSFSRNFIRVLSGMGVRFRWNTAITALCSDDAGRITGLRAGDEVLRVANVVLCPGAHAGLTCGTLEALSDISSMVGMWITLPNEHLPLSVPLKIRRRGFGASQAAEGANIIPGRDAQSRPVIYCSSGHGYVGLTPDRVSQAGLHELLTCIKDTSRELFPDKYAEAERRGMLDVEPEYCIRPWTSSGLGLFDRFDMANGGQLVLTGGHNTGGFAQAPSVACAVRDALRGVTPHMAEIYHPQRADTFLL